MNILFKYANTKIDNINCEDKEIVKNEIFTEREYS